MARKSLQFAALMLYALVLGVFWGTWFAQSRTMHLLSAATFLENGRQYIANLAFPMRILMPASLAATLLAAYSAYSERRQGRAAFGFTAAAALLMAAAFAITLTVNVPIDDRIKTWTLENLPTDWGRIRDHWEVFHCLRTWTCFAGFASLTAGILASKD